MRHARSWILMLTVALGGMGWGGCATDGARHEPADALRVGVCPEYPPLAFIRDDAPAGVEIDFARLLARTLGRPVVFHELKWDALFPALSDGRVDILMSGLSVTSIRRMRARFAQPYLQNGLLPLARIGNGDRFGSQEAIRRNASRIGVIPDTTADAFVRRAFPKAVRVPVKILSDVPVYLNGKMIDVFIDDAYAVLWLLTRNEAAFEVTSGPLTEDELAWAVAMDNEALLTQVNDALQTWTANGQRDEILDRWIPYRRRLMSE